MITLTPRLQAVADYVPSHCRFADVGTDHAYLPVWLIQHGIIHSAVASDLRQGPLDRARATARQYGCTERFDFRLSDGLDAFAPHEADCIAVAGMGGEAIRSILSAAAWTKEHTRLILQPQTNVPELRLWLTQSGYHIREDRVIREENRWYTVLLAEGGGDDTVWTPGTLLTGNPARWSAGDDRKGHLRHLLEKLDRQLGGLTKAAGPDQERQIKLSRARQELTAMLEGENTKCQP